MRRIIGIIATIILVTICVLVVIEYYFSKLGESRTPQISELKQTPIEQVKDNSLEYEDCVSTADSGYQKRVDQTINQEQEAMAEYEKSESTLDIKQELDRMVAENNEANNILDNLNSTTTNNLTDGTMKLLTRQHNESKIATNQPLIIKYMSMLQEGKQHIQTMYSNYRDEVKADYQAELLRCATRFPSN